MIRRRWINGSGVEWGSSAQKGLIAVCREANRSKQSTCGLANSRPTNPFKKTARDVQPWLSLTTSQVGF